MFVRYSLFEGYGVDCFTTTNMGGVSKGEHSSFNLSLFSNDIVEDVDLNRTILCDVLGVESSSLYIPFQTHEDKIKVIDEKFLSLSPAQQAEELHGYDALITNQKNICIGITTADCVPLLIYDTQNKVLAAVHAGWKGTVQKIGAKTVEKMRTAFGSQPSNLLVAIGPSISPKMFEVGDEVGAAFIEEGFLLDEVSFRNELTGKLHINLWQANVLPLLNLGVRNENIEVSGICTRQSLNFFSARRQTIRSGRMVTGGVLK